MHKKYQGKGYAKRLLDYIARKLKRKGARKIFVDTSGKIANFCSRKCEKNLLKLKRKPLETRWTEAYRKEHKKS